MLISHLPPFKIGAHEFKLKFSNDLHKKVKVEWFKSEFCKHYMHRTHEKHNKLFSSEKKGSSLCPFTSSHPHVSFLFSNYLTLSCFSLCEKSPAKAVKITLQSLEGIVHGHYRPKGYVMEIKNME